MPTVWIPSPMQSYTGGQATVEATGGTVRAVIEDLENSYPGLKSALMQNGMLRPGVAVAVDGQIVQRGLRHPVGPDSEVCFVPAVGGG